MFNLKASKKLHVELTLAEDEIKSLQHTLQYIELTDFERDIYSEMLGIAQRHKKQAEKDLMDFYIDHVDTDFSVLLCA